MFKTFAKKCVSINDDICRRLQKKGEKNENASEAHVDEKSPGGCCHLLLPRSAPQRKRMTMDENAEADGSGDSPEAGSARNCRLLRDPKVRQQADG